MQVYRIYIRPSNKSETDGLEIFIRAENKNVAVRAALKECPGATEFGAIMIDEISNGIIIETPAS